MKYIKTYEDMGKYNIGDIVIAILPFFSNNSTKNYEVLMVIQSRHVNGNGYLCNMYDDENFNGVYVDDSEIIKKVSSEEAEMITNSDKYNL